MNVALTLSLVPAANVTACALVRTRTVKGTLHNVDGSTSPYECNEEISRVEFVACGDFVWTNAHGTWSAEPRETARARYKNLVAEGYVKTDAKTEIVGQCDAPATREEYAWGEGANRVGTAEIPAQVGPVSRASGYRGASTRLPPAFSVTTPDKWTSLRTSFSRVDEETAGATIYVHA